MELLTDAEGNAARASTTWRSPQTGAGIPPHPHRPSGAHAVRRRDPRRPVRIQHTGRRNGPVIIDLPQAIDAAANNHACQMLLRDVPKTSRLLRPIRPRTARHRLRQRNLGALPEQQLHPDIVLTGRFERDEKPVDLNSVMREINDTLKEEEARKMAIAIRLSRERAI